MVLYRPPARLHGTSGSWSARDLALDSPLGREARISEHVAAGTGAEPGNRSREQGVTDSAVEREIDVLSGGPPVHALFVYNSNPGAVAPNHNAVRRGLARTDLFTVVHDLFFNDTTDYADYVLPATTFLEHTDIQGAYGHYFVQLSNQAIEPPGEARSNVWLFSQLAQTMGFTESCFRDTEEQLIRQALAIGLDGRSKNPGMEHISFEDLEEQGHIPLAFHREPRERAVPAFHVGNASDSLGEDRVLLCNAGRAGPGSAPRLSLRRPNRVGVKTQSAFRWSF